MLEVLGDLTRTDKLLTVSDVLLLVKCVSSWSLPMLQSAPECMEKPKLRGVCIITLTSDTVLFVCSDDVSNQPLLQRGKLDQLDANLVSPCIYSAGMRG